MTINEQDNLTGKRFRSKISDEENDCDYGEVTHPAGSIFTVGDPLHIEKCDGSYGHYHDPGHTCGQMYAVLWEQAVDAEGEPVPAAGCKGMWTIWSADEIRRDAVEANG